MPGFYGSTSGKHIPTFIPNNLRYSNLIIGYLSGIESTEDNLKHAEIDKQISAVRAPMSASAFTQL